MFWIAYGLVAAAAALGGAGAAGAQAPPPGRVEVDRVTFRPQSLRWSGENYLYADGVLESLKNGTPADPTSDNHDALTSIPAPGVIRLSVSGRCNARDPEKPSLCVVRNEIRELKDDRPAAKYPAYYAIRMRLARAAPGARNIRQQSDGSQRLMLAQIKFAEARPGFEFSPLLALRYEDDLLFITADLSGEIVPRALKGNRCEGGALARMRPEPEFRNGPFRVLVASEDARLPFDFDPTVSGDVVCVRTDETRQGQLNVHTDPGFPRLPRGRFTRIVMQIDGGAPDTTNVRLFANGKLTAWVSGRIMTGVAAERSYFKFGPYGSLPPGRQLSVDYADFRRAPSCRDLGLTDWKGSRRDNCLPRP